MQLYESDADLPSRSRYFVAELMRMNGHPAGLNASDLVERRSLELLVNRFITEARFRGYELQRDPQFWPAWMSFCNISTMLERAALPTPKQHPANAGLSLPSRTELDQVAVAIREGRARETRPWSKDAIPKLRPTDDDVAVGSEWAFGDSSPETAPEFLPERTETAETVPALPPARPESPTLTKPARATEGPTEVLAVRIPNQVDQLDLHCDAPLSVMARGYLQFRRIEDGDGRAEEDAGLILQFAIDLLGDLPLSSVQSRHLGKIETALPDIPKVTEIPAPHRNSLYSRYLYAKEHGWDKLQRVGETRIRNGWHRCLNQFFNWAREKGYFKGEAYEFNLVGADNPEAGERDAWRDEELIRFFSLPLFTGAWSSARIWVKGRWLVQGYLYWAYLIAFLTGMRPSEIAKLRVDHIVQHEGIWCFDIRKKPRATNGQPAVKLKRNASYRLVPIHLLLIDLGLLERWKTLGEKGETSLFPDLKLYIHKKSGREMWGHQHSKSWQYVKKTFGFDREELTLYGGRHTVATWYDEAGIPQRVRNRLLGHAAKDTADEYGAIALTRREAQLVIERKSPVEEEIAEILITAKLRADYEEGLTYAKVL